MTSEYEGFHVYGSKSAFKFEIISNSNLVPVISIDGAPSSSGVVDWQLKSTFQITQAEQPLLLCFLLGVTPLFKAQFHGPKRDKSIEIVNQPERGSLYVKIWQAGVPIGVEIPADKAFYLSSLALKVLSMQSGFDPQTCLAVLRGSAGRLLISSKI
jgi:hypothetical protein